MFAYFKLVADRNWQQSEFNEWFFDEYPQIAALKLDPLYVSNDVDFFEGMASVTHSNIKFNLQEKYYAQPDRTLEFINYSLHPKATLHL